MLVRAAARPACGPADAVTTFKKTFGVETMIRLSLLFLVAAGALFAAILPSDAAAYRYQVLYAFCPDRGCGDGSAPYGRLHMDGAGNLYGTTVVGGANGFGAVFELTPNATRTKWTETVLYSFCSQANCADGSYPYSGLIVDRAGHLYGTTSEGGASDGGVVFELTMPNSGSPAVACPSWPNSRGARFGRGLCYIGALARCATA